MNEIKILDKKSEEVTLSIDSDFSLFVVYQGRPIQWDYACPAGAPYIQGWDYEGRKDCPVPIKIEFSPEQGKAIHHFQRILRSSVMYKDEVGNWVSDFKCEYCLEVETCTVQPFQLMDLCDQLLINEIYVHEACRLLKALAE